MGSPGLLRGRTILIVESELLIRLEVASLLEAAGAQVIAASTTRQGLAALGQHHVCAALLDYGLPEDNAAELCRQLAERQIPFMFYTGHSELERSYPHAIIVEKPANPDVLLAAMVDLTAPLGSQTAADVCRLGRAVDPKSQ
jgi:DNA-binding response OmpR family regulator